MPNNKTWGVSERQVSFMKDLIGPVLIRLRLLMCGTYLVLI